MAKPIPDFGYVGTVFEGVGGGNAARAMSRIDAGEMQRRLHPRLQISRYGRIGLFAQLRTSGFLAVLAKVENRPSRDPQLPSGGGPRLTHSGSPCPVRTFSETFSDRVLKGIDRVGMSSLDWRGFPIKSRPEFGHWSTNPDHWLHLLKLLADSHFQMRLHARFGVFGNMLRDVCVTLCATSGSLSVMLTRRRRRTWPNVYSRFHRSGKKGFVVDLGLIDGKRARYSFTSKAEADAFADAKRMERQNEGTAALALPLEVRQDAAKAYALLGSFRGFASPGRRVLPAARARVSRSAVDRGGRETSARRCQAQ